MLTTISIRINTLLLLLLVLMAAAIITMLATRASGGPLDPPGAPSATGTLPQVEPRSPIPPVGWNGTFPILITQSGSYFLTRNLTTPGGGVNGIEIKTSDVTLDLRGFMLNGFDRTGKGIASMANNFRSNVSVEHGTVRQFADGIDIGNAGGGHVSDVRVYQTGAAGIAITPPGDGYVEDCVVDDAGVGVWLVGATMRRCIVQRTALDGVYARDFSVIEDSSITSVLVGNPDNPNYGVRVTGANVTIRDNSFAGNNKRDILVTVGIANILDNSVYCADSVVQSAPFLMNAPMGTEPHANFPRVAAGFC